MVTTILKATRNCNLACKYCYAGKIDPSQNISLETVKVFFEKIKEWELMISDGEKTSTSIIWHGGEPLLLGQDFYKNAFEIQKELSSDNFTFRNSMQSNGTLLTEEYFEFLHKNKVSIGLSLDGPKHINDRTRVYPDGSSTYDDVMKAAKIIDKKTKTGFITVITSKNINDLEEIADHYYKEGYNFKLNPLVPAGTALEHEDLSITPNQYGNKLSELFVPWFGNDGDYSGIDTFKDILKTIIEDRAYGCNFNQACQDSFISLVPNGNIYPCARFDEEDKFLLGNIYTNTIDEIMNNPIKLQLKERYKTLDDSCKACDMGNVCNGGCMHNAYLNGDIMGKDPMCVGYKKLYSTIKKELGDYVMSVGGVKVED